MPSDATLVTLDVCMRLIGRAYKLEVCGNEFHLVKQGADPVQISADRAEEVKKLLDKAALAWDNFLVPDSRSGHIHGYRYNPELCILEVRFKKNGEPTGLYHYFGVTPDQFDAFHRAGSLTAHLNTVLAKALGKENYEEVKEAQPDVAESLKASIDSVKSGADAAHPPTVSTAAEAPDVADEFSRGWNSANGDLLGAPMESPLITAPVEPNGKDGFPVQPATPPADPPTVPPTAESSPEPNDGRPVYKIIGLHISGFQRIDVFDCEIDPHEGVTILSGNNAQGKSSVLDAIECLVGDIPRRITQPINKDHESCKMKAIIGKGPDFKPTYEIRRWRTAEGSWGRKLVYAGTDQEVKGGTAKQLLDEFLGSFQQVGVFDDADPVDQRAMLIKVLNLDLDEIEAKEARAKDEAKKLEQKQDTLKARFLGLPTYDDVPTEEQSIGELSAQLQSAIAHNAEGERLTKLHAGLQTQVGFAKGEVARLEALLEEARSALAERSAELSNVEQQRSAFVPVDVAAIESQIQQIDLTNQKVRANKAKAAGKIEWETAETELKGALERLKEAEAERRKLLSEAKMPVEGLGFDEKQVTFNGLPLKQASQAERVRVDIAIVQLLRGSLCPLLVRDASHFDNHALSVVAEEAQRVGTQALCEIPLDRLGRSNEEYPVIYIHDGRIAEMPEAA